MMGEPGNAAEPDGVGSGKCRMMNGGKRTSPPPEPRVVASGPQEMVAEVRI